MVDRADVYGDMDKFDQKLKTANALGYDDSSEDEQPPRRQPMNEAEVLKEKNRILMEKLFRS